MYKATFDSEGNRTASYRTDIHTNIPVDAIEISDEDQALYVTNNYIRGADGIPQLKPVYIPTLEELKAIKWNSIKSQRDTLEQSGVSYLNKTLDSDTLSVQRISIAVQAAQAAISAGQSFTLDWTCQDNSTLTMTAEDICGIPVALATYSNSLHQTARGLRTQIEAATTAEELELIAWPT